MATVATEQSMTEEFLEGKKALVTGGSRGIGKAIAIELARKGAFVFVNYHANDDAARQVVTDIENSGGKAQALKLDVGSAACEDTLRDLAKSHDGIDILVNNAGIARDQLLIRVKSDEITDTFNTNVASAIYTAKALVRPMMKKRWGRIINISSVVGESGNPGQSVYAASKAALLGLTKTLAREYASRGITVNAISPGFIETDMTATLGDNVKETLLKSVPLARLGQPEDIAKAALFLAGNSGSYITGQVLRVNGGLYM